MLPELMNNDVLISKPIFTFISAFGNTHQNDLFDTLNQVSTDLANQANNHEEFSLFKKSGQNLHEIMNSWTLQNGYPLVRVTIANQNNLQFTQVLPILPSFH